MTETEIPGIGSCGPRMVALSGEEIERRKRLVTKHLRIISKKPDYTKWRDRLLSLFLCSDDAAIAIMLEQSVPETLIMLHILIKEGHRFLDTGPHMIGTVDKEEAERLGLTKPVKL